jgi:hypothetical protein
MPQSSGEPQSTKSEAEPSNGEKPDEASDKPVPEGEEPGAQESAAAKPEDWWSPTQPAPDWAKPSASAAATEVDPPKKSGAADVYFCGRTILFSLNRALQAIVKEKLTGSLRAFWDHEPIDLLARDGEIVFLTTRDPDLYCSETPTVLANVDVVIVDRARDQQRETGAPFFLTLAREESIDRQPAMELMQHHGQRLFSGLWTAPRVWIMFEKNADLLSDAADVSGTPNVDDWALETLRLVQNLDQHVSFDPTSIPAYTKDGFERIQKLKLTSDEAQFASQFNGARSVQQIAKNLRLDLKSARLTLFRFLALEIVECWPASTAPKPEPKSVLQRLVRRGR